MWGLVARGRFPVVLLTCFSGIETAVVEYGSAWQVGKHGSGVAGGRAHPPGHIHAFVLSSQATALHDFISTDRPRHTILFKTVQIRREILNASACHATLSVDGG